MKEKISLSVQLHPFWQQEPDETDWWDSPPGRCSSWEAVPDTHWICGWADPRAVLDILDKINIFYACWKLNHSSFDTQPTASRCIRCNIFTVPAHFANTELLSIVYLEREGKTREGTKCSCSGGVSAGHNEQFNSTVTAVVVFPSALLPAKWDGTPFSSTSPWLSGRNYSTLL